MDQDKSFQLPVQKETDSTRDDKYVPREDRKQSKLGMFSLLLAILSMLGYIILSTLGTSMIEAYITPEGKLLQPPQEDLSKLAVLAGAFLFVVILNAVGLILGFLGSGRKYSKKSMAVIGAIINAIVLVTLLAMFVFVLNG